MFFSGITACAVNMVERIANSEDIALDWMEVDIESYRDADKTPGRPDPVRRHSHPLHDVGRGRRPGLRAGGDLETPLTLYGSVAVATADTTVGLTSHSEKKR